MIIISQPYKVITSCQTANSIPATIIENSGMESNYSTKSTIKHTSNSWKNNEMMYADDVEERWDDMTGNANCIK